jgi:hypothetical protein
MTANIDDLIDDCDDENPAVMRKKRVTMAIHEDTWNLARKYAPQLGISLSSFADRCIEFGVKQLRAATTPIEDAPEEVKAYPGLLSYEAKKDFPDWLNDGDLIDRYREQIRFQLNFKSYGGGEKK